MNYDIRFKSLFGDKEKNNWRKKYV